MRTLLLVALSLLSSPVLAKTPAYVSVDNRHALLVQDPSSQDHVAHFRSDAALDQSTNPRIINTLVVVRVHQDNGKACMSLIKSDHTARHFVSQEKADKKLSNLMRKSKSTPCHPIQEGKSEVVFNNTPFHIEYRPQGI